MERSSLVEWRVVETLGYSSYSWPAPDKHAVELIAREATHAEEQLQATQKDLSPGWALQGGM